MPTADTALPGRDATMPVAARHLVLDTPIVPPFPDGFERIVVGMGCFWGAERLFWQAPGVYTTAVGYAGGFTPNPDLRRDVLRSHRSHRGRARRLRPGPHELRGAAAHLLGGSRPHAGHASGQRRRHAVPLGDLLARRATARRGARLARHVPGASSTAPATAASPPRSPRPARSTTRSRTTSSTSPRTRTATAGSAAPASAARSARAPRRPEPGRAGQPTAGVGAAVSRCAIEHRDDR